MPCFVPIFEVCVAVLTRWTSAPPPRWNSGHSPWMTHGQVIRRSVLQRHSDMRNGTLRWWEMLQRHPLCGNSYIWYKRWVHAESRSKAQMYKALLLIRTYPLTNISDDSKRRFVRWVDGECRLRPSTERLYPPPPHPTYPSHKHINHHRKLK